MLNRLPDYLHITNVVSFELKRLLNQLNPDKVGLLVDENTKEYCLSKLDLRPDILVEIKSGEQEKNLQTCNLIWKKLTGASFSRKSVLINLGGGVIGDMGGFAASTYKRGIAFINIPTTLLSQVDASIGGKLGVDYQGLKNHIGVFQHPYAVLIDKVFLNTLSKRQLLSGYAEVIKHALIYDQNHWENLNATAFDELDWTDIIPKSIHIKNQVVTKDPLENDVRKILNFGHTLGHAIESYFLNSNQSLLHGEAVAIGMILESHLSLQLNLISIEEYKEINQHIKSRFCLPNTLPNYEALVTFLRQDKKNINGKISFSLLEKIGSCVQDKFVSIEYIKNSLLNYAK
ncbi:MAG: 3-dehydroquinate synthase [Bacteroidota bacterium]